MQGNAVSGFCILSGLLSVFGTVFILVHIGKAGLYREKREIGVGILKSFYLCYSNLPLKIIVFFLEWPVVAAIGGGVLSVCFRTSPVRAYMYCVLFHYCLNVLIVILRIGRLFYYRITGQKDRGQAEIDFIDKYGRTEAEREKRKDLIKQLQKRVNALEKQGNAPDGESAHDSSSSGSQDSAGAVNLRSGDSIDVFNISLEPDSTHTGTRSGSTQDPAAPAGAVRQDEFVTQFTAALKTELPHISKEDVETELELLAKEAIISAEMAKRFSRDAKRPILVVALADTAIPYGWAAETEDPIPAGMKDEFDAEVRTELATGAFKYDNV